MPVHHKTTKCLKIPQLKQPEKNQNIDIVISKTKEMSHAYHELKDSYERHSKNLIGSYESKLQQLREEIKIKDQIIKEQEKKINGINTDFVLLDDKIRTLEKDTPSKVTKKVTFPKMTLPKKEKNKKWKY